MLSNADNGVLLEKPHQTSYLLSLSQDLQRAEIISCFHTFCCERLEKHARVSQRHVVSELDLNLLEGEQVGCLLGIAVDTEGNIAVTDCI